MSAEPWPSPSNIADGRPKYNRQSREQLKSWGQPEMHWATCSDSRNEATRVSTTSSLKVDRMWWFRSPITIICQGPLALTAFTVTTMAPSHDGSDFTHQLAIKLSRALNIINPNDLLAQRVTDIAKTNTVEGFTKGAY